MGVATANSILMVSFAREQMDEGIPAVQAAVSAGFTRMRPGTNDGAGYDHRDGSYGVGLWGRWRAECATGTGRHRRIAICDGSYIVLCAKRICDRPWPPAGKAERASRELRIESGQTGVPGKNWSLSMSAENESKQNTKNMEPSKPHGDGRAAAEGRERGAARAQRPGRSGTKKSRRCRNTRKHQPPGIQKPPDLPPAPPRTALIIVGVMLLVLLIAGGITLLARPASHSRVLAKETERNSVPTVAVSHPIAEKPDEELVLPGSLQAYEESPIYARTSGYLVRWYKDIGSRVEKGELLAKIDTPEVDQELNQARAARQQIVAQMDLAKISADRWENLRKTDSVSAQETDQYWPAPTSRARLIWQPPTPTSAGSNSLRALRSLRSIFRRATRRNVDPGALINAGAGAAGRELFDLARVDPLRVFTSVPQAYAPYIKVGATYHSHPAGVSRPEVCWQDSPHGGSDRSIHAYITHRSRCTEQRRSSAARLIR